MLIFESKRGKWASYADLASIGFCVTSVAESWRSGDARPYYSATWLPPDDTGEDIAPSRHSDYGLDLRGCITGVGKRE